MKIINGLFGAIVASYVVLAGFAYWLFFPYKVFEVKEIKNLTPIVKAGGTFSYEVSYCKYMPVPGQISKTLVNDIVIPFTPYRSDVPVGCDTRKVFVEVPHYAPLGEYHVHIVSAYEVNPIRTISISYETPTFQVIK